MQSTGQTVAQDMQLVQLSLLMTLMYRVSFLRSSLRVWKYSSTEMVMLANRTGGSGGASLTWAGLVTPDQRRIQNTARNHICRMDGILGKDIGSSGSRPAFTGGKNESFLMPGTISGVPPSGGPDGQRINPCRKCNQEIGKSSELAKVAERRRVVTWRHLEDRVIFCPHQLGRLVLN
jgi:hypothetical protein